MLIRTIILVRNDVGSAHAGRSSLRELSTHTQMHSTYSSPHFRYTRLREFRAPTAKLAWSAAHSEARLVFFSLQEIVRPRVVVVVAHLTDEAEEKVDFIL